MITTKKSQKERIIDYIILFGSISSWEAYKDLGITQLGARIDQLKKRGFSLKQSGNMERTGMERVQHIRDIF